MRHNAIWGIPQIAKTTNDTWSGAMNQLTRIQQYLNDPHQMTRFRTELLAAPPFYTGSSIPSFRTAS